MKRGVRVSETCVCISTDGANGLTGDYTPQQCQSVFVSCVSPVHSGRQQTPFGVCEQDMVHTLRTAVLQATGAHGG